VQGRQRRTENQQERAPKGERKNNGFQGRVWDKVGNPGRDGAVTGANKNCTNKVEKKKKLATAASAMPGAFALLPKPKRVEEKNGEAQSDAETRKLPKENPKSIGKTQAQEQIRNAKHHGVWQQGIRNDEALRKGSR